MSSLFSCPNSPISVLSLTDSLTQDFTTLQSKWPKRPVTFETFDQSDEETRPVQQKDNDKDKYNDKYKDNGKEFRQHHQRAVLETCDLRLDTWDTDYIADNWEQQLHCDPWVKSDGDSIRNSCDVYEIPNPGNVLANIRVYTGVPVFIRLTL